MSDISETKRFGGVLGICSHRSAAAGGAMTCGLLQSAAARRGLVPVLWFREGLTCRHEDAMIKAGAQAWAAAGIAGVFPDTAPRRRGE